MSWRRRVAFGAILAAVVAVGPARAHQVSTTRFDAPIPLALLYVGTGLTIALTAALLVVTGRDRSVRRLASRRTVMAPAGGSWIRPVARVLFVGAVVAAVLDGLLGRQVAAENLATVAVWPLWFEGIALVSAAFGSPWRVLSPWRALYDWVTRFEPREVALLGAYPDRLGSWPAVAFFLLGVGIVENLTVVPRSPRSTAALAAGYALCMLAGAFLFGREWFARADALEVLYRLFGRVAPLRVIRTEAGGYAIEARAPWTGCSAPVAEISVAAFVVATVYTVTFDGFTNAPEFQTLLFAARAFVGGAAAFVLYLGGYLAFVVAFAAIAQLTVRWADRWGGSPTAGFLAIAPTLLPIAVAYEVAHYYPFVFENLGLAVELVAEHLTGAHLAVAPLGWLSLEAFWLSQVVLIVGGHAIAVVAVHGVVVDRASRGRLARATLPMTALMVGYTVLSLWIVSRPIVN